MLRIYGSMMCPDCMQCRNDLDKAGVKYEYLDFADSLWNVKLFLNLRDSEAVFAEARECGKIGIPCIQREDGTVTLDWEEFL